MKDSFCVTPWIQLATSAEGCVRVCCFGVPQHNYLRDENGVKIKLSNVEDFEQVWNSHSLKRLRAEMISGQTPAVCSHCQLDEKSGMQSLRNYRNKKFKHLVPDILSNLDSTGAAPRKLAFLDLRFGNVCNLGCRMCYPASTRYLIREWKDLFPAEMTAETEARLKAVDWYEEPKAWDHILDNLENVERIYLTGGEPMLAKTQYRLLEKCIESGRASKITLEYNSNMTILDPVLLEYWKHFQQVILFCSIDGIGSLNEYIRYPSKWAQIDKNLRTLDDLAHQNQNMSMKLSVTVQAYNVLRLVEVFRYLEQSRFRYIELYPHINVLNQPSYLNVAVLPEHLKDQARAALEAYMKDLPATDLAQEFKSQLQGFIRRLLKDGEGRIHASEFVRVTEFFDRRRGQKLADVVPELATAFGMDSMSCSLSESACSGISLP